jgi:hypothetical protein
MSTCVWIVVVVINVLILLLAQSLII